jgi:hypothetical protein
MLGEGITHSGQLMGTVDYMAPEQAFDTRYADARSDIYSLGCSLYRLLTGQSMYGGTSVMQKLLAHRSEPVPDMRLKRSDIPAALQAMFERMVAKKPQDRYATIQDVLAALDGVAGELTSARGVRIRPPRGRRILVAAGAAGFMALVLGAVVTIYNKRGQKIADVAVNDSVTITVPKGGSVEVKAEPRGAATTRQAPTVHAPVARREVSGEMAPGDLLTLADYEWSPPENLGPSINSRKSECLWGISGDELLLYFDIHKEIYSSRRGRSAEPFSTAIPVAELHGLRSGALSSDGLMVVAVKQSDDGHDELWSSTRPSVESSWSVPVRLGTPVNTDHDTQRPVVSPDGLTLLANSTRRAGAFGDVWIFTRASRDVPFATAELLSVVSTAAWDMPYFVSNDRCVIIASSQQKKIRDVRVFTRKSVDDVFAAGDRWASPSVTAKTATRTQGFGWLQMAAAFTSNRPLFAAAKVARTSM